MNSSNNDSNRNYPRQRRNLNSESSSLHRAENSRGNYPRRKPSGSGSGYSQNPRRENQSAYDKIMNNVKKNSSSNFSSRSRKERDSLKRENPNSRLYGGYLENEKKREEYKIPLYEYDEDNLYDDEDNNNSKDKNKKNKKKSKLKTFIKIFFLIIFIVCFAAAGAVIGAIMGIIDKAPKLELIAIEPNIYTSVIYDSAGNEIDKFHGEENREYVTLDKIPKNMRHAIIAIEDERFYSHGGIDYKGILRAVYETLQGNKQGASTLTQQLIKNNITKVTRNNIETKIQEMYLATKYEDELESQLGSKKAAKDYILELYLNTIYLNHGYNGVQAAALGYFGKDVSELTLSECAVLAGITNSPTRYSPRLNPENNQERQRRILKNMLDQGYITQNEYTDAYNDNVYSRISEYDKTVEDTGASVHSYFIDGLFEQVSKDLQEQQNMSVAQANNLLYNGGLKIHSTLDQNIQSVVDEAYLNNDLFPSMEYKIDVSYIVSIGDKSTGKQEHKEFKQLVRDKGAADSFIKNKKAEIQKGLSSNQEIVAEKTNYAVQPQSAMVILDYKTGEVKAIGGGRGEKVVNRGLNRATDSARQPGSVFKVLAAFTPGIDMGVLTPSTVIDDVPLDLNGYKPKNWYKGYKGLSTIRDGIRESMNIVAVKAMNQAGIDQSYEYLLKMGFTTLENDNHASTALGGLTKGVTQLETTAAYGMIANGGKYYKPSFYTKVYDHNGNLLLEKQSEPEQIIKESTAYCVTDMMKDVITSGTGTKAKFKSSNMPIAGKTGTTQNSRDLTFVGYTPYYAAGIWLGYDRYDDTVKNMESLKDQSAHLKVWQYIMEKIHEGLPVKDFEKPANGLVTATICSESGKLAVSGVCDSDPRGSRVRTENFVEGTEPTEYCDVHKAAKFCSVSGMSAGPNCPSVYTQIGIQRPEPYEGSEYIDDQKYEIRSGGKCNIHSSGNYNYNEESEPKSEDELTPEINENPNNENPLTPEQEGSAGTFPSFENNNNGGNNSNNNGNNNNLPKTSTIPSNPIPKKSDTDKTAAPDNNSGSSSNPPQTPPSQTPPPAQTPAPAPSSPTAEPPVQTAPEPPPSRTGVVLDDPL